MRPLKFFTAAALALSTAVAVPSVASTAEPSGGQRLDESVRCFVVTSMLMTIDDAETKQVGQMGSIYFMGRLDGALSDKDLEDRLFSLSQTLANEDLDKVVARCGEIMKARGASVEEVGKRVEAREQAAAAAKK